MKNTNNLFVSVVIPAAGKGTRMNVGENKQLIEIKGKPILAWTLETFQNCSQINEIVLVTSEEFKTVFKNNIVDKYGFTKVSSVQTGGYERQHSVFNGLKSVDNKCDIVLIHDGARPFIDENTIINSIKKAQEFGAACVAVQQKDSVKFGNEKDFIEETLDRSRIWIAQTPQAFRFGIVMDAHISAEEEDYFGNDDSVLVERFFAKNKMNNKVKIVVGKYDNIKITTNEDIAIANVIADYRLKEDN